MINILRILVPIDFSAESELALDWAQMVARNQKGATLYILHTLPLEEKPGQLGMASVAYKLEMEAIKQKMTRWLNRLPPNVVYFTMFATGRVPEAIARACEKQQIDMVVMTTRGRRGMTHILEGSVTEETVRLASCPVLVLHLNDRPGKPADQPFSEKSA
jgi:nucleotide-binding universal stress UspA family protein